MLSAVLGDEAAARPVDQECVDGSIKLLGENHLSTLTRRNNLAVTLKNLGEVQAAKVRGPLLGQLAPQPLPCPLLRARRCDRCSPHLHHANHAALPIY